jgi:catechol 2,3-dioxygenase-like lactoylglutathione lyase family enzyme
MPAQPIPENTLPPAASRVAPLLDHVVINVRENLDQAQRQYEKLGFALTPRGHHTLGSSNHLAIFGTDYLELLGYEQRRSDAPPRTALLERPLGLSGLVFKPGDVPQLRADLAQRGIHCEPPQEFSRPVALADGSQQDARFRVLHLPRDTAANGVVFFCHHFTPELVWRDEWRNHPNGAVGIREFVIAARDPSASAAIYAKVFGQSSLVAVPGGVRLEAGTASVLFLSQDEVDRRFAGLAPNSVDGSDRFVGLVFETRSLAATRAFFERSGAAGVHALPDRIVIAADAASGVALAFES